MAFENEGVLKSQVEIPREEKVVVPKEYRVTFVMLVSCFILWGLLNNMTDNLVPAFGKIFMMSAVDSSLVQFAFYGSYAVLAIPAAIAGVDAIDTVWSDLDDEEGFRNEVKTSANMGFAGKSCIHPSQVKIVHEIFTPTKEELEKSLEIVKAAEAADISKGGVITVNGKMVDIPVIAKAEKVVRLAKSAGMIK